MNVSSTERANACRASKLDRRTISAGSRDGSERRESGPRQVPASSPKATEFVAALAVSSATGVRRLGFFAAFFVLHFLTRFRTRFRPQCVAPVAAGVRMADSDWAPTESLKRRRQSAYNEFGRPTRSASGNCGRLTAGPSVFPTELQRDPRSALLTSRSPHARFLHERPRVPRASERPTRRHQMNGFDQASTEALRGVHRPSCRTIKRSSLGRAQAPEWFCPKKEGIG